MLANAGLDFAPDTDDLDSAADVVRAVAAGRHEVGPLLKQTPAALLMVKAILDDYGHKIIEDAERVRHLVMNKLVIETENPDPRMRLRALELLGKLGDVGLFVEKREVVVTHQTSDEVRERLRARLARLVPADELDDAIFADAPAGDEEEEEVYHLSLEPRLAAADLFP
jgi:Mg2+ and Co2+ transporter CorA